MKVAKDRMGMAPNKPLLLKLRCVGLLSCILPFALFSPKPCLSGHWLPLIDNGTMHP
jgi:hypothetical protein